LGNFFAIVPLLFQNFRDLFGNIAGDRRFSGYISAGNLDNPGLMVVFERVLANPVSIFLS
jgi:hypothetical protein